MQSKVYTGAISENHNAAFQLHDENCRFCLDIAGQRVVISSKVSVIALDGSRRCCKSVIGTTGFMNGCGMVRLVQPYCWYTFSHQIRNV